MVIWSECRYLFCSTCVHVCRCDEALASSDVTPKFRALSLQLDSLQLVQLAHHDADMTPAAERRRRAMLVAVTWLLLLLLHIDGGHSAPRARSSSYRDDMTTRGDDLVTDTESGRVRGIRYHVPYLRRPVDAYLGIPFAKPPLNSLRFRPPQPIEKWQNIRNATRLPNSCYQLHDTVFGTDFHVNCGFYFTSHSHNVLR